MPYELLIPAMITEGTLELLIPAMITEGTLVFEELPLSLHYV